jgi:hypothetical protein
MTAREHSHGLRAALSGLARAHETTEKSRSVLLGQVQKHLVEAFSKYGASVKLQESAVRRRNADYALYLEKHRKYLDAKKKHGAEKKQRTAKAAWESERKRMESSEASLNAAVTQFESARIAEMKFMLKRYCQSEMHVLATQLEEFSRVYSGLCELQPDREVAAFLELLKKSEFENADKENHSEISENAPLSAPGAVNTASAPLSVHIASGLKSPVSVLSPGSSVPNMASPNIIITSPTGPNAPTAATATAAGVVSPSTK